MLKKRSQIINFNFFDSLSREGKGHNFAWFILFTPFFIYAIRSLDKINPNLEEQYSEIIPTLIQNFDKLFINNFFVTTLLGSFLPIIAITFFELINCLNKKRMNFRFFSLGRIRISKGFKYADIWYFVLSNLHRFPKILFFLTLGTSFLHKGVTEWFHNSYTKLFSTEFSTIFSLFIFIFVILFADFLRYINHIISHKIPLIWDLHEFHHSATEMTILSSARDVKLVDILLSPLILPFEVFTALFINEFLSQGLMLPIIIYLIDYMFDSAFLFLGHSSLKVIYPKPLSLIYMSPALHLIHHSNNPDHYDKNFGIKFTFWDKLFNTYLDETHVKNIYGYGVENTEYNKYHPLFVYCILPIKKMIKRFKTGTIFQEKLIN